MTRENYRSSPSVETSGDAFKWGSALGTLDGLDADVVGSLNKDYGLAIV
jgi:hypothetical protein